MILLDNNTENYNKYAIASVFHDIGIWTHSFDYITPSIFLAKEYLTNNNQEEWIEEISLMIEYHHKIKSYQGNYKKTVEIFRKADWVDVSKGFLLFDIEKAAYKKIVQNNPQKGFHLFLIFQSLKYFIKHPFRPLPMFRM